MAVDPTQIARVNIEDQAPIKVAYNDPSLAGQYSEFLKKEDLYPKYEKEDPLFQTLKDDPITLGGEDLLGSSAGLNLWSLSKEDKEERKKQLGKFGYVPEDLAFGLDFKSIGQQTDTDLSINIPERKDSPLFSEDKGTDVVKDPVQAMQETVQDLDDKNIESPSWLEKTAGRLLEDPDRTQQQAESIWDVIPQRPRAPSMIDYSQPYQTGLATMSTPSSIGTSAPPPASLAGQGNVGQLASATGLAASNANLFVGAGTQTGLGTLTNVGAAGTGPAARLGAQQSAQASSSAGAMSGALKTGATIMALWSAKNAFDSGTTEGKLSGSMQLAALLNPALAPYVAAYEAIKWFTGWGGFGGMFGGDKQKVPMGGAEYRVTSTDIIEQNNGKLPSDSDQSAWLNAGNPLFDQALKEDKLRITVPYSWGYNGFDDNAVKQAAQKQVDYLYAFADKYGLDVNEDVFIKAATGSGGFEKYKPTGDRAPGTKISVLERVDSVGNGSLSANQWLREVMEYEGPNGEKIVDGTPRSSNINPETGMYEGFTSQEEFQQDVARFNSEFYG